MAHQIQKVKQSTILEIQNSRHESEVQIHQMNKELEKQQNEHEQKKQEIKKLQDMLNNAKVDTKDINYS